MWENIFEPESNQAKIISDIRQTYYLVNIVDNDFINGDIFRIFNDVIERTGAQTP